MVRTYLRLSSFVIGNYQRTKPPRENIGGTWMTCAESEQHFKVLSGKELVVFEWSTLEDARRGKYRRGKVDIPFDSIVRINLLADGDSSSLLLMELKKPPNLSQGDQFWDNERRKRAGCAWEKGMSDTSLAEAVSRFRFYVASIGNAPIKVEKELKSLLNSKNRVDLSPEFDLNQIPPLDEQYFPSVPREIIEQTAKKRRTEADHFASHGPPEADFYHDDMSGTALSRRGLHGLRDGANGASYLTLGPIPPTPISSTQYRSSSSSAPLDALSPDAVGSTGIAGASPSGSAPHTHYRHRHSPSEIDEHHLQQQHHHHHHMRNLGSPHYQHHHPQDHAQDYLYPHDLDNAQNRDRHRLAASPGTSQLDNRDPGDPHSNSAYQRFVRDMAAQDRAHNFASGDAHGRDYLADASYRKPRSRGPGEQHNASAGSAHLRADANYPPHPLDVEDKDASLYDAGAGYLAPGEFHTSSFHASRPRRGDADYVHGFGNGAPGEAMSPTHGRHGLHGSRTTTQASSMSPSSAHGGVEATARDHSRAGIPSSSYHDMNNENAQGGGNVPVNEKDVLLSMEGLTPPAAMQALEYLSVVELKNQLRLRQLRKSGRKLELIRRLLDFEFQLPLQAHGVPRMRETAMPPDQHPMLAPTSMSSSNGGLHGGPPGSSSYMHRIPTQDMDAPIGSDEGMAINPAAIASHSASLGRVPARGTRPEMLTSPRSREGAGRSGGMAPAHSPSAASTSSSSSSRNFSRSAPYRPVDPTSSRMFASPNNAGRGDPSLREIKRGGADDPSATAGSAGQGDAMGTMSAQPSPRRPREPLAKLSPRAADGSGRVPVASSHARAIQRADPRVGTPARSFRFRMPISIYAPVASISRQNSPSKPNIPPQRTPRAGNSNDPNASGTAGPASVQKEATATAAPPSASASAAPPAATSSTSATSSSSTTSSSSNPATGGASAPQHLERGPSSASSSSSTHAKVGPSASPAHAEAATDHDAQQGDGNESVGDSEEVTLTLRPQVRLVEMPGFQRVTGSLEDVSSTFADFFEVLHCPSEWIEGSTREHCVLLVNKVKLVFVLHGHRHLFDYPGGTGERCFVCNNSAEVFDLSESNLFFSWLTRSFQFKPRVAAFSTLFWDSKLDPHGEPRMCLCPNGHITFMSVEQRGISVEGDHNCETQ